MKAYTELAEELGVKEGGGGSYVSKLKARSSRRSNPGGSRHFGVDYTGRSHLGEGFYVAISGLG